MKDNHKVIVDWRDRGEEPSLDPNNLIYLSKDIWIRRDSTSGFSNDVHKNAEYDTTIAPGMSKAYIFVRVRNRGCDTSLGTEQLSLHWSKAFLAGVSWPTGWNGATTTGGIMMGDLVGSKSIPQIPPGGQTIMRFTWTVPDPNDYSSISTEKWHFCLAARVIATNDLMAVPEGPSIATNTVNNNNIVWKNVSVIRVAEIQGIAPGAIVGVGNIFSPENQNVFLEFNNEEGMVPVTEVAEVYATLDETLFEVWDRGGRQGEGIDLVSEDERIIRILENGAKLQELNFEPYEWGTIKVSFNFFTADFYGDEEFKLYLTQNNSDGGALNGGELYHVKMGARDGYEARMISSNQTISKNDTATLTANSIGEPAIYEWYNSKGQLVGKGQTVKFVPSSSDEYKLRTLAKADGFVDYQTVSVDVVHNAIKSLVPNPASDQVTITYDAKDAKTAEIRIQAAFGSYNYTYAINTQQNSININVANYQKGIYSVMLIHDGVIVDSKQLSVF